MHRSTRYLTFLPHSFPTLRSSDLNHIPFADHGALLDPPTEDVTARCISMMAQLGYERDHSTVARGLAYLRREQQPDGSWFGRWGTNYIYGTWSVLCAFNAAGEGMSAPPIRQAGDWLISQNGKASGRERVVQYVNISVVP